MDSALNRPVEDWGKLLGDVAAVTAMLDRLLHHGHVLKCGPRSWRTKLAAVEEFTKSRAYRTTGNALVEGKNGAVVRKQIGYGPIASEHAEALQQYFTAYFNPYLNFHRPCGYATVETNARGKRKRTYRHKDYRTPYEKLTSLPEWEKSMKVGITAEWLQRQAGARGEAARRMQKAKLALLARSRKPR